MRQDSEELFSGLKSATSKSNRQKCNFSFAFKHMFAIYVSASVHSLATPVGSLVSGPLLDEIGRRGSLQFAAVPLFVGWFVIGFAKNISCLLIGRVILGFGVGLMGVPAQVGSIHHFPFQSRNKL